MAVVLMDGFEYYPTGIAYQGNNASNPIDYDRLYQQIRWRFPGLPNANQWNVRNIGRYGGNCLVIGITSASGKKGQEWADRDVIPLPSLGTSTRVIAFNFKAEASNSAKTGSIFINCGTPTSSLSALGQSVWYGVGLNWNTTGNVSAQIITNGDKFGGTANGTTYLTPFAFTRNEWHSVQVLHENAGTNGVLKLYVDGTLVSTRTGYTTNSGVYSIIHQNCYDVCIDDFVCIDGTSARGEPTGVLPDGFFIQKTNITGFVNQDASYVWKGLLHDPSELSDSDDSTGFTCLADHPAQAPSQFIYSSETTGITAPQNMTTHYATMLRMRAFAFDKTLSGGVMPGGVQIILWQTAGGGVGGGAFAPAATLTTGFTSLPQITNNRYLQFSTYTVYDQQGGSLTNLGSTSFESVASVGDGFAAMGIEWIEWGGSLFDAVSSHLNSVMPAIDEYWSGMGISWYLGTIYGEVPRTGTGALYFEYYGGANHGILKLRPSPVERKLRYYVNRSFESENPGWQPFPLYNRVYQWNGTTLSSVSGGGSVTPVWGEGAANYTLVEVTIPGRTSSTLPGPDDYDVVVIHTKYGEGGSEGFTFDDFSLVATVPVNYSFPLLRTTQVGIEVLGEYSSAPPQDPKFLVSDPIDVTYRAVTQDDPSAIRVGGTFELGSTEIEIETPNWRYDDGIYRLQSAEVEIDTPDWFFITPYVLESAEIEISTGNWKFLQGRFVRMISGVLIPLSGSFTGDNTIWFLPPLGNPAIGKEWGVYLVSPLAPGKRVFFTLDDRVGAPEIEELQLKQQDDFAHFQQGPGYIMLRPSRVDGAGF